MKNLVSNHPSIILYIFEVHIYINFFIQLGDPCEETAIQVMCRSTCKKCGDPDAEVYHRYIKHREDIIKRGILMSQSVSLRNRCAYK